MTWKTPRYSQDQPWLAKDPHREAHETNWIKTRDYAYDRKAILSELSILQVTRMVPILDQR